MGGYAPKTTARVPNLDRTLLVGKCWVVDGDTIRIGGAPIRLAGIDAPELDHPYGEQAKWAMVRLCKGQTIRAEIIAGETSHDRYVARCYLPDGRDLAAELVRMGLAIDWPKFSGGRYSHLEVPGVRKKLWRCDARQKGRLDETPLGARIAAQRQRRGDDLELIEPET